MLTRMSMCDSCVSCSLAKIRNCKEMFTFGFSYAVSGFGQVFKVTRAVFLFFRFSFLLFLFFIKLTCVFSRGRHSAKAPRRTREKASGTQGKRCLVKQIFFRMADMSSVELYFAVFAFLEAEVRLFPLWKSWKIFRHFPQPTKRLENNWAKETSSSRLFVCHSNFLAVYCWRHFTGYCKLYWRIRNLSQSESVKYLEWILSGVMFRSCRTVFKYVSRSRISWLRLGHEITFFFFVV